MWHINTCRPGEKIYPGYEQYWSAIQNHAPGEALPMTGKLPIPAEVERARFAARTPHYVLSTTMNAAHWPTTKIILSVKDVAAMKRQPGKDIYLMGGVHITTSLLDAGLVDELRPLACSLVVGEGKALIATSKKRHALKLMHIKQLEHGVISLVYTTDSIGAVASPFCPC